MPKRALGDITNRQPTHNIAAMAKRPAKPQNATTSKRARQVTPEQYQSHLPVMNLSTANAKVIDIDASDKLNRVEGSDFAADIHNNHLVAEKRHLPKSDYLDSHRTVSRKMRAILVDWLADVCVSLKLSDSTLHLCVHILDRFLQTYEPNRSTLQLVGSVCLYIAAKYEEIYAPEASDFVTLSDGAFSKDDVIIMEATVLNALRFQVTTPYCLTFLARIGKVLGAKGLPTEVTRNVLTRAQMFVETAMVDGRHLRYRPSHLAASSVLLALDKLNIDMSWCGNLAFHSGWSKGSLLQCVEDVRELVDNSSTSKSRSLNAISRKFSERTPSS
ncbi:Cyclin [Gracilaria domingensis]|nr:Cyclin [Gracilaria domingensis]